MYNLVAEEPTNSENFVLVTHKYGLFVLFAQFASQVSYLKFKDAFIQKTSRIIKREKKKIGWICCFVTRDKVFQLEKLISLFFCFWWVVKNYMRTPRGCHPLTKGRQLSNHHAAKFLWKKTRSWISRKALSISIFHSQLLSTMMCEGAAGNWRTYSLDIMHFLICDLEGLLLHENYL